MSISGKHFYRFTYLKSDHWDDLRLRKLAKEQGFCKICRLEKWNNDVHHICYRNLYDVKLSDLVVVCRDCHKDIHKALEKTQSITNVETSKARWRRTIMSIRKTQLIKMKLNTTNREKMYVQKAHLWANSVGNAERQNSLENKKLPRFKIDVFAYGDTAVSEFEKRFPVEAGKAGDAMHPILLTPIRELKKNGD